MYTVDEKIRYGREHPNDFREGYKVAVTMYRNYPTKSEYGKKIVIETMQRAAKGAKNGHEFSKGMMSGFRDAAKERKKNNKN